jgi:poly(hydroxyalkanoate) depolymerase family esterase
MMNDRMQTGMAEATRLTRAGRVLEATAVIQQTIREAFPTSGTIVPPSRTTVTPEDRNAPIDTEFRVVDDTPPPTTARPGTSSTTSVPPPFERFRPSTFSSIPFPTIVQQPPNWYAPPTSRTRTVPPDEATHVNGQFIDGTYTGTAGTRSYKLYIPSRFTGQALPLLIMLHGCTQSSVDFATGTRMNMLAEKELFFVAYPEQTSSANGLKCWNWFQAAHQQRGAGEPSLIAGITQQIMSTYPIDASRVSIAGLSSGGAMAATMAATYPDLYAAVGVHSGIAHGAAQDLLSALRAMKQGAARQARPLTRAIPIIVFHGDSDTTVSPVNADRMLDQWLQMTPDGSRNRAIREEIIEPGQVPGGHAYTRVIYADANGRAIAEKWVIHQAGHAWSGGSSNGSFTDPKGPGASAAMVHFFAEHPKNS